MDGKTLCNKPFQNYIVFYILVVVIIEKFKRIEIDDFLMLIISIYV